jgi:hypothetical protein
MGLLESGSRWVDIALTQVGRKALAEGSLDIAYYSFDDAACSYSIDGSVGGEEWLRAPSGLVTIEAHNHPNDEATVTTDEYSDLVRDGNDSPTLGFDEFLQRMGAWSDSFNTSATIRLAGESVALEFPNESARKGLVQVGRVVWQDRSGNVPSARIDQHEPIQEDADFSGIPQLAFLPPVVSRATGTTLGTWSSLTPTPPTFNRSNTEALSRAGAGILQAMTGDSSVSWQFFRLDRVSQEVRLLAVAPAISDDATLRVWNVGEVVKSDGQAHFFRIFRVVLRGVEGGS